MEELARFLLLLLAVAVVINLVRGGRGGVAEWLRAKFLGKAPGGPAAAKK